MVFANGDMGPRAELGLGLEMVTTKRITSELQYAGDFGDDYNSHAGMFRVGYLF